MEMETKYCPCYCEENSWQLMQRLIKDKGDFEVYVMWMTNKERKMPIRYSKFGDPVVWDYHVAVVTHEHDEWQVWDRDSLLPCPCPLQIYLEESFSQSMPDVLQPTFRLVGREFLDHFASDRSHMRKPDGTYHSPPPSWPCLRGSKAENADNMQMWLNVDSNYLNTSAISLTKCLDLC